MSSDHEEEDDSWCDDDGNQDGKNTQNGGRKTEREKKCFLETDGVRSSKLQNLSDKVQSDRARTYS